MDVDILIFSSAIINVLKKHYFIIFIIDYKNPSIYKFCLNPTIFTVEAMSWQYSKILTSANGATISWWNLSWRFNSVVCVWVFECCPSKSGWQQLLVGANLLWACWQSCFVPNHPSAARPINTTSQEGHNICLTGTAAQENCLVPAQAWGTMPYRVNILLLGQNRENDHGIYSPKTQQSHLVISYHRTFPNISG